MKALRQLPNGLGYPDFSLNVYCEDGKIYVRHQSREGRAILEYDEITEAKEVLAFIRATCDNLRIETSVQDQGGGDEEGQDGSLRPQVAEDAETVSVRGVQGVSSDELGARDLSNDLGVCVDWWPRRMSVSSDWWPRRMSVSSDYVIREDGVCRRRGGNEEGQGDRRNARLPEDVEAMLMQYMETVPSSIVAGFGSTTFRGVPVTEHQLVHIRNFLIRGADIDDIEVSALPDERVVWNRQPHIMSGSTYHVGVDPAYED